MELAKVLAGQTHDPVVQLVLLVEDEAILELNQIYCSGKRLSVLLVFNLLPCQDFSFYLCSLFLEETETSLVQNFPR